MFEGTFSEAKRFQPGQFGKLVFIQGLILKSKIFHLHDTILFQMLTVVQIMTQGLLWNFSKRQIYLHGGISRVVIHQRGIDRFRGYKHNWDCHEDTMAKSFNCSTLPPGKSSYRNRLGEVKRRLFWSLAKAIWCHISQAILELSRVVLAFFLCSKQAINLDC